MKTIGIVRGRKAYLPEVEAYKKFFQEYNFLEVCNISELAIDSVDLIWMFMGNDFRKHDLPVVHEYASMSVPPLARCKDYIKSKLNIKPNFRIFLNETIRDNLKFNDEVQYCYRDMGVDDIFFATSKEKIQYDCVYVGSMSKDRELNLLLDRFKALSDRTILMVGEPSVELYRKYKKYSNIVFTGYIYYQDVPKYIMKAQYAINYIPDKFPFNIQTSTKLLEYAALGMNIITTSYKWADEFEKNNGMKFYHINANCMDLDFAEIDRYNFINKNVEKMRWSNILAKSGIRENLKKII